MKRTSTAQPPSSRKELKPSKPVATPAEEIHPEVPSGPIVTLLDLIKQINVSSCFCHPGGEETKAKCTACEPIVRKWTALADRTDRELFTAERGLFKNGRMLMLVMRYCPYFIPENLMREHLSQMIIDHRKLNFCITGQAGCGKSYAIKELSSKLEDANIKFCRGAPTGTAALNIEGSTLHSLFGFMAGDPDSYEKNPVEFFNKI
jgi:hypothetical protein